MIGVGSNALVGKDTLFTIFDNLFPNKFERIALADLLKHESNNFCQNNYGISAFTKDPKEKEIIRPFFVVHGKIKRTQTKGKYWTSLVQNRVDEIIKNNLIPFCTDIRYAFYAEDEIFWLKTVNNGIYIHINRYDENGVKMCGINDEEKEQEKLIERYADYKVNWPTSKDLNFLTDIVKIQLKPILDLLNTNGT